ncbi:MAG: translocation/assembly module TamB [Lutibacter sp.]|uniref:translocation/assembly module TamB domain-containing protein n=1 Tax=Lutibacter sp. TaxID=1925666 RepID=UPI0019F113BF|nr:translocation/assembly module TamB domain-containing protein [Lutibacter sp.]NOR29331.1 translocation/assembly module TamB [Lutibacter sp.]
MKKEFDVAIKIKKVDLSFLGSVQLKDVLIRNHHTDTLIYVQNLTTSVFSYRNMINSKLKFGQISLNNFKVNMNTYEGEVDDALTVFVDKFDDGVRTGKPSGFLLTATNLKLANGYVELIDENKPTDKPLFFININGGTQNFKIEGPNVYTNISGLNFVENHGIEIKNLSTDFTYTKSFMNFLNTKLETENSTILTNLIFTYKREDFSNFNDLVTIEADVISADVSLIDLKKFYNELGTNDVLHFTTKITGKLNDLNAQNLKLFTDKNAIIKGDLNFKNSFNQENGFSLEGNLTNLTSDYNHLKTLLPNVLGKTLPSSFMKLGRFTLNGNVYLTENLINTQLYLSTKIGNAVSDLELTNISNIDEASYIGHIKIIDFDLGKITNNPLIGNFSIEGDVDGEGFTLETMNTSVNGVISQYQYNNYNYKNITLNGVVKSEHFNGEMEVNDENIKLNFNGLANFSSDVYTFNFKTLIDYCDLKAINVFKRDSISNVKGEIEINVKGNSLDDLVGTVDFNNSLYTNQKGNYFFKDFNVTSSFLDSIRTITINSSEIVDGHVKGIFKFNELGKLAQNSIGSIYSNYNPHEVSSGQFLDFRFKIYNKIVEVFYPEITLSANSSIRGTINSDYNLFKLSIKSPKVEAFTTVIDDLNLQIDNKNPLFNTQLSVDKISTNNYDVSDLQLVNITLNDTLYFRTEFKGGKAKTEDYNLSFYHTFNKDNKSVFGIQKSNFTFKNNEWLINPTNNLENKVVFDNVTKTYTISPFLVSSKNEKIELYGVIKDTISKELHFNFKDVKLSSITPEIDSLKLKGTINGTLDYNQLQKKIKPTANLLVSNVTINNSKQGNLKIDIEGKNSLKKYVLNILLENDESVSLSAIGELNFTTKQPTLDVNVNFEAFKLDAFSPLGEDVFNNIRGFVYGDVQLTGLLNNPTMEGDLFLDEAGLYFPYINVDYDFDGTSIINLKGQNFVFEDVNLKDKAHNTTAQLSGTLSHSYFDNWLLDLSLNTTNLLVLNTVEEETSVYYGTGFIEGNATIKGLTDKLIIDVVGKTKKGTRFVIPISDVKTVESSQLIRFINKNELEENEEKRKAFISEKLKGLSLNFNIEVTKDAVVEMVLDKTTGSYLQGSGTGNLQLELDTKDKFDMYGDFVVDNGIYNFKYGGFINKPFTVKKGGSISWSGDPYTAQINIDAVHRVSANPKSLLENITSNRKIPIDLITRFSGELFNSQRDFDIEIPNSSSTVASELAFKLNDNDKTSKTRHFVSLLASGAFYNESDLSVNTNGLVYGTASDLISNAFDNIFNKGNNRFKFKPVYTVGEKNKVNNLNIDDQLLIALDYQVNDRVIINGKVGVPISSKEQSSVIGEVNVEFLMNEEGTLRSSVFNRQNEIQYTEEEEGYTQGAGLSYQIDFDNSKELLEKIGLRKKTVKDTINTLAPTDTLKINKKLIEFKNKKNK